MNKPPAKSVHFLPILWVIVPFFFSCDAEPLPTEGKTDKDSIYATPYWLSFDGEANVGTLKIRSSGIWEVDDTPEWIYVTPQSGMDNGKLHVFVTKSETEDRKAQLILRCGEAKYIIDVLQEKRLGIPSTPTIEYATYTYESYDSTRCEFVNPKLELIVKASRVEALHVTESWVNGTSDIWIGKNYDYSSPELIEKNIYRIVVPKIQWWCRLRVHASNEYGRSPEDSEILHVIDCIDNPEHAAMIDKIKDWQGYLPY